MTLFQQAVYRAVQRVPRGKVATYADIAKAIGRPKAVRAVGTALNHNPDTSLTPCHRVVRSNGALGGYAWGSQKKRDILISEGIRVEHGHIQLSMYRIQLDSK